MEGKAILFKAFGDVDAVPIVLNTQDPQEIIETIERISPTFGGINLEDIASPQCFYIEEELKKRLNIPVFHDDQHGTAIVVLAGMINALKLAGKDFKKIKLVVSGAGAASIACIRLLVQYGVTNIITLDSKGIIHSGREDLNDFKKMLLPYNIHDQQGTLDDAMKDADVFLGLSSGNLLHEQHIQMMSEKPIIFALANPEPEILPEKAKAAGCFIVATGRSDYPNQVNNLLAFPGIFRGALDARIPQITDAHKVAAAEAIAAYLPNPTVEEIIPNALDKKIAEVVAKAVVETH